MTYHDIMQFLVSNLSVFRSPPRIRSHPFGSTGHVHMVGQAEPHKRRLLTVPAATLLSLHRHDMT